MPGGTHGRSDLGDGDGLRVIYGVEHARDVAALMQGADRTMRDALPAIGTVALRHRINAAARTGIHERPYGQGLHLRAYRDASKAGDALRRLLHQRIAIVDGGFVE